MKINEFLKSIPNNLRSSFRIAYAVANMSYGGTRNRKGLLGAVITNGNRIIAAKPNSYKTHTKLLKYSEFPFLHAEASTILHAGISNLSGNDLFVLRIKRDNSIAMAKPCEMCQELIKQARLRRVYFTNENGLGVL